MFLKSVPFIYIFRIQSQKWDFWVTWKTCYLSPQNVFQFAVPSLIQANTCSLQSVVDIFLSTEYCLVFNSLKCQERCQYAFNSYLSHLQWGCTYFHIFKGHLFCFCVNSQFIYFANYFSLVLPHFNSFSEFHIIKFCCVCLSIFFYFK